MWIAGNKKIQFNSNQDSKPVPSIEGYGNGKFHVDGTIYEGSLIVLPNKVISWQVREFSEINEATLLPNIALNINIDLLLLGCGKSMWQIPTTLNKSLAEIGVVVEPMSTGAAVRTYNVLLGEKRRIAAALISVE